MLEWLAWYSLSFLYTLPVYIFLAVIWIYFRRAKRKRKVVQDTDEYTLLMMDILTKPKDFHDLDESLSNLFDFIVKDSPDIQLTLPGQKYADDYRDFTSFVAHQHEKMAKLQIQKLENWRNYVDDKPDEVFWRFANDVFVNIRHSRKNAYEFEGADVERLHKLALQAYKHKMEKNGFAFI
jgi:hypothetical protein